MHEVTTCEILVARMKKRRLDMTCDIDRDEIIEVVCGLSMLLMRHYIRVYGVDELKQTLVNTIKQQQHRQLKKAEGWHENNHQP